MFAFPDIEFATHLIIWIGGVLYSILQLHWKSKRKYIGENTYKTCNVSPTVILQHGNEYEDFEEGWWFLGRKKDVADYEWETILPFIYSSLPWITFYIAIGEFLRQHCKKVLLHWQTLFSLIYILYLVGYLGTIVITGQILIFEACYVSRKNSWIYACSGSMLLLMNGIKSLAYTEHLDRLAISETQHFFIILIISWMNLKCMSYFTSKRKDHTFLSALAYCLYLPTLILGPFTSYEDFIRSHNSPSSGSFRDRAFQLISKLLRYTFWLIFTELSLHYIYVNALLFQAETVFRLNWWQLCGYGYCMGQFFHLKYLVFYGLSTTVCNFESVRAPSPPKCIGRICFYSDMWKHFDRGLYNFLVKHVYGPLLHLTKGNKAIATTSCFVFVYIWHGLHLHIFMWTFLNLMGLWIERLIKNACNAIRLSYNWRKRILCLASSPLLVMSAISNFYFFTDVEIGNIFVERCFFNGNILEPLVLLFFLHSCCQVSIGFSYRTSPKNDVQLF